MYAHRHALGFIIDEKDRAAQDKQFFLEGQNQNVI